MYVCEFFRMIYTCMYAYEYCINVCMRMYIQNRDLIGDRCTYVFACIDGCAYLYVAFMYIYTCMYRGKYICMHIFVSAI